MSGDAWISDRADEVFSLGQPLENGVLQSTRRPPFLYTQTRFHGDDVREGGASGAGDFIAMDTHYGTHVDSVFHVSLGMRLRGGIDAGVQDPGRGIRVSGVQNLVPIVGRGVLLDVAGHLGVDEAPADYALNGRRIEAIAQAEDVRIGAGDVVLFRTGRDRRWGEAKAATAPAAGPDRDGAEYLASTGLLATGSDTSAYERFPNPDLAAHGRLLVEAGIPILENLNLWELARRRAYTFLFFALPLHILGATGSPVAPLAVVRRSGERGGARP